FGLAGGGVRRARALLLSCAVRSATPGGPARPLVRPRSLVLPPPPPPPPPLHGRARPAPPPRPVAARPRPRRELEWGRARVPASGALSESRTPSKRKGEGAGAGGRRIGAAARPSRAGIATPRSSSQGAPVPTLLARRPEPGEAQPVASCERPLSPPAPLPR
ncbi:hypothetical protein P7K49_028160, partial [Saguinus oedipus]